MTALFYLVSVRPLRELRRAVDDMRSGQPVTLRCASRLGEYSALCGSLTSLAMQWEQDSRRLEKASVEELRKVEKLATLGEMAYSIAHDIKNPLAGISGAMQVFSEDFPPEDPRGGIIREILGEIERLDRSIRDLLSFARPPEPHPMPVPVAGMVDRVVSHMRDTAQNARVDVNILDATDGVVVDADPELIHQALSSMVRFSLRNMPNGGSLSISSRLQDNGERVEIRIMDTGEGMDSESLENLFRPFRTSRVSGAGLSMAISRNIIERHGGSVEVESTRSSGKIFSTIGGRLEAREPGVPGTVFRIMLPRHKGNA